jgi:hypothetical protein
MPNDLDLLMARFDEINAKDPPLDPDDIAILIANARRQRALKASGTKPTRANAVSLDDILNIIKVPDAPDAPKPQSIFKRTRL